ncbi:hypothetical protein EDD21DRAFT_353596 [Dissophora ornata]|nr:hypothetical protein EDD21DRAFT_353596 [Dissophora ornata]
MSAPMRSLLSSLAPLNATTNLRFESMSRDLDKKQTFSEQGSSKNDTKGTGDMTGHSSGPVENRPTKKNVDDSEELGHTSDISEGAPSRDIANTPIDIADDPLRVSKTGLSFLHHHEVEAVTSPEADHRSQSILSSSLVVSDQYDSLKKVGPLSNPGTASNKTSSDVERKSETIVETSMDSTSKSPLLETKASHSVDKSDGESRWSETKETGETRVIERAQMDINSECPFQQQLALQAQEQEEQEQDENDLQLGSSSSGFKTRRKRINSIGGKKLLLKKKSSLHNLHGSFQQQQQQSQQQAQPQFDSNGSNADDSSAASTAKASAAPSDYVIPPFYFPMGKPVAATKRRQRVHSAATKAKEIFVVVENGSLSEDGFVAITVQCCELPRYMNRALFRKVDIAGSGEVRFPEFERVWESLVETCPDEISMIFMILKQPNANVLTPTDFEVLLQDLVLFHPGLEFLSGNAVFQERYLETVITRIFYESNRRHGKMSLADLRRSNFDKTLRKLENSDLNQTEDCFSYKHFYVIYCKFWELDQDHDLILDEQDLAGYSGGAISMRIIRRVMQGYGNETGMFVVPDQELLLQQQQQQQIMFMQHQQQLQQQQQLHHLQQQQVIREQALQDQYVSGSTLGTTTTANQDLGSVVPTSLLDAEAGMVTVDLSDGEEAVEQPNTLRRSNSGALSLSEMSPSDTTETATVVVADVSIVGAMSVSSPGVDAMLSTFSTSTTMMMNSTHNMAVPQRVTLSGPGGQCRPQNYRMTYKGFIWFLLAETDKQTTTSIEYWFRCMDLDGDGVLTVFELEQLFQEQATRMAILGMESFGFRDAICQMQDLVGPRETGLVRLSDLKQCGQAGPFIDLFCNVVRWRSFEAHQHQIRMRQQQIAMQRAADAAWEEVVTGEDLFDGDDDDEEDDDEEIDDDHLDDDLDDDDLDDDDLEDGDEEMDNLEDDGEEEGSGSGSGSGEFDDEDTLTKKSELKGAGRAESEGGPSCSVGVSEGSCKSPEAVVTARRLDIAMTEAKAIAGSRVGLGLGVTIIKGLDSKLELGELPYQSVGFRSDNYTSDSRGGQEAKDKIAVEMSNASVKALKRKRAKERRRRRRQAMMRRALLEEQRKEKALLATIRESPWIVYVESEYEKLVTIERPQSRTGWDQEEEEEDEEEEEMDDDDEEEVMDEEDMMIEEGRDPIAAAAAAAVAAQQLQQLQHQLQQHQLQQHQFQQHQQLQQRQLQHQIGFAQIEVDVAEGAFAVQMDHRTQQTKTTAAVTAIAVARAAAAKVVTGAKPM